MPTGKNKQPKRNVPLTRCGELVCRAVEGSANQYEITFSSEQPDKGWCPPQILVHSSEAVDLSRFADVGTLMFAHGRDPNYGKVPIGKVVKVWLDETERKCRAVIELDEEDEKCQLLKNKLDKGMLRGVSVRGLVDEWVRLRDGETTGDGMFVGPVDLALRWTPYEISLEPTPADASVGVGKSINYEEENSMDFEDQTTEVKTIGSAPATAPAVPATVTRTVDPPAAAPASVVTRDTTDAGRSEERARVTEIMQLCRGFGVDATVHVAGGDSVDRVRTVILERMQSERGALATGTRTDVSVTLDEGDKLRRAAADGLLLRSGQRVEKPADGSTEFRGMTVQQIAVECLSRSGVADANRLGRDELFRRSMTPDSAFSAIASNVASRTVIAAHETAPTTFQYWTAKGSAPDFRPTDMYEISESGELDEIPQNGEFKEGKLSDQAVATRRLLTFGKRITFSRQLFINDDIEIITRTLTAWALAFARGTNKAVYNLLKSNPAMFDGKQLFSASHGNLGTGEVPGTASFAEARRMMRRQKDLGGSVTMNIAPAYVLSSATDETSVEALLVSLADPSANNSGVANVFRNKMQQIVDAELDVDSGAQPYYFAADPRLADTIEVSYLNGVEAPTVETRQAFDQLGMEFRIYGDRGVTLTGYRGLFKNPGKI